MSAEGNLFTYESWNDPQTDYGDIIFHNCIFLKNIDNNIKKGTIADNVYISYSLGVMEVQLNENEDILRYKISLSVEPV